MIKHGMHMAQYSIHNLCCIILRNSKELQDNTGWIIYTAAWHMDIDTPSHRVWWNPVGHYMPDTSVN